MLSGSGMFGGMGVKVASEFGYNRPLLLLPLHALRFSFIHALPSLPSKIDLPWAKSYSLSN